VIGRVGRAATPTAALCVAVLLSACGASEDTPAAPAATTADSTPSTPATNTPGTTAPARIVSTDEIEARTVDLTIDSPALAARAKVRLLLPAPSARVPESGWPVLYLLHGCCDTYQSWTRYTDVAELTADTGVLVVMPDGGRVGFYSDWLDGPGWETFHLTELPQLLAESYGAGDRRAIAGLSMGGLGALSYPARHPEMFAAAASFSGIVHTQLSPQVSQNYLGLLRQQGADPVALWGDPATDAEIWAEHNPYELAAKLLGTSVYISVGDGRPGPLDPPGASDDGLETMLHAENVALRDRLSELGVEVSANFYGPGTHTWPYWQRALHDSWPMLSAALTSP
jgi:diacylglycerol O-acyltransferase / trehalose O-mycolyltransferase / mycolyltransferase Ag85